MKIACVQMNIAFGKPDINLLQVENLCAKRQSNHKADVIVFPEMWNTGYALKKLD